MAEVYGPDYKGQIELAAKIKKIFQETPGVVDVDWYVEDPQTKYDMKVDLDKAALQAFQRRTLRAPYKSALSGASAGLLHDPRVARRYSRSKCASRGRTAPASRISEDLKLPGPSGEQVSLREVTNVRQTTIDQAFIEKTCGPWFTSRATWQAR